VLSGMIERAWGRIVNVSSGVAANPNAMIGANAYTATKAALEAHTLNLAAELHGTGVTANVFRPGIVDTAMQGWIREQDPEVIGAELHQRFIAMHESGTLLSPERSASALLEHLCNGGSGEIWAVTV
jgi:NAD(P)-dependent dehydrogenase (short-subunit alcohol dehydrogenase family)